MALGLTYLLLAWVVSGKFGSVIRAIRDDEARVRFLGYSVETYKLFVFTLTAVIVAIAGALYYPQAGIINPAELAPIASIYLAVWVAIGGRGRLYGAVIGAAVVSLLSTWFTGGRAPSIPLGFATINWVDWWQVLLSPAAVLARVQRLTREGYILGYEARLNPLKLGAGLLVFVEVLLDRTTPNVFDQFKAAVQVRPEIMECHMVAGGFDYLLKTRSADMNAYRAFAGSVLWQLPGVRETRTYAVMEEVKHSSHLNLG